MDSNFKPTGLNWIKFRTHTSPPAVVDDEARCSRGGSRRDFSPYPGFNDKCKN